MNLEPLQIALLGGLILGVLFGAVAQATAFCSSGAIVDLVHEGNSNRLRAWGLAVAVAILASQLLLAYGIVDVRNSIYVTAPLALVGPVIGGVMFGIGMVWAQGCPARNLVRLGSGNVRSLVVLIIFAATAYATIRGILAPARVGFDSVTRAELGLQGLPELIAGFAHIDSYVSRWVIAVGTAGLLAVVCLASKSFRASPRDLAAGCLIGLIIAAGWYITGTLSQDEFNPTAPASLSFVAPLGDSLQYLMFYTGASANFGVALAGGVLLGALATALLRKRFRIQGFNDQNDFFAQIAGSVLMGIGAVLAAGCTVGHGLTGLSALSLGSLIAVLSICLGGYLGARLPWSVAGSRNRIVNSSANAAACA